MAIGPAGSTSSSGSPATTSPARSRPALARLIESKTIRVLDREHVAVGVLADEQEIEYPNRLRLDQPRQRGA